MLVMVEAMAVRSDINCHSGPGAWILNVAADKGLAFVFHPKALSKH